MTTFNKLPYLKVTLPYLIAACKADEEIVIVDGGSTDGTKEYLEALFQEKKIHQFISEKDFGEAHGTNKGFLLAKGEVLKIITDDDIFDYIIIAECKKIMFADKAIDVIGTDGISCNLLQKEINFDITNYTELIKNWKLNNGNCWFCGLSLMIRKTSLAYLGLFHTNFTMVDFEYISRISVLKPNLKFCSSYSYANIVSESSNSIKKIEKLNSEKKRLNQFYFNKNSFDMSSLKHKLVRIIKNDVEYKNNLSHEEVCKFAVKKLDELNKKKINFI